MRTPLRSAISCAWPNRPKPVTSVTAFGMNGRTTSAAAALRIVICSIAADASRLGREHEAGAERLREEERVARGGPCSSARSPSGCTVPTTARPYFGSASRIVCPPARIAPAARTCSAAAAKMAPSTSVGSSSGNAAIDSASSGVPPIAKMSFNAFVAAMRPNVAGSSTSGGKKSSVKTIARSSSSLYTAASSAGDEPDEQVLRLDGNKAPQELLEACRRVLRGAAAAHGQSGKRSHDTGMVRRRRPKPPSSWGEESALFGHPRAECSCSAARCLLINNA